MHPFQSKSFGKKRRIIMTSALPFCPTTQLKLKVNYDLGLNELIADARIEHIPKFIDEVRLIGLSPRSGQKEADGAIICLGAGIAHCDITGIVDRMGFRHANIWELVAYAKHFGKDHPEIRGLYGYGTTFFMENGEAINTMHAVVTHCRSRNKSTVGICFSFFYRLHNSRKILDENRIILAVRK
jgi:hypothetical protein